MLVLVVAVRAVQVPVVDVVEVPFVDDRDMAAARPVDVLVAALVDVVLVAHRPKLARARRIREPARTGPARRAQSPAGWRTRNPREGRVAACQRVPALALAGGVEAQPGDDHVHVACGWRRSSPSARRRPGPSA